MDQAQYRSLMAVLAAVPDPRKARGKQLEWALIMGVIATALLSQQRSAAAMAQWAHRQAVTLVGAFRPSRGRIPRESTLRRALQCVDVGALERQLAEMGVARNSVQGSPVSVQGHDVDGTYVRGAGAHGASTLLVSLVTHSDAEVIAQTAVVHKRHESSAIPPLLAGRDLTGCVITMDAGLTQPKVAAQILAQGGHYLMVVKRNQRQLYEKLTWFFDVPPLGGDRPWREVTTINKGHGRLETRRLTCTDDLDDFLNWPCVQQVLRRECERVVMKTGEVTRAVTYAVTSLATTDAPADELAVLWRGLWTIENRQHYVRDVTFGEDAHQKHVGHAPQVLAAVRNSLITLLRRAGWQNIAAGLRHSSTSPTDALCFIGAIHPGL